MLSNRPGKSHVKCFIKDKTLIKCVQGTCNVEAAFEELDEIFHIVQPHKAF